MASAGYQDTAAYRGRQPWLPHCPGRQPLRTAHDHGPWVHLAPTQVQRLLPSLPGDPGRRQGPSRQCQTDGAGWEPVSPAANPP
jgi:hypothetical protein